MKTESWIVKMLRNVCSINGYLRHLFFNISKNVLYNLFNNIFVFIFIKLSSNKSFFMSHLNSNTGIRLINNLYKDI